MGNAALTRETSTGGVRSPPGLLGYVRQSCVGLSPQ